MNTDCKQRQEETGKQIVDIAFQLHKKLGPGLLEVFMKNAFVMN
jgi:hypothetical protein